MPSASPPFSGGFLVSVRAINIISTDSKEARAWGVYAELYGVFTKGGQKGIEMQPLCQREVMIL